MNRYYAFEAAGISDTVRAQLERVERAVDSKGNSVAACEAMLDKIAYESNRFDTALETMIDAARARQNGEIDAMEMNSRIVPAVAELKDIARSIGVATEADSVSEDELKDSKDYLEGSKEIVESKKDEEEAKDDSKDKDDDDDDSGKDDDDKDDGKECEDEKCDDKADKAEEAATVLYLATEAYLNELDTNDELYTMFGPATEGTNADAMAATKAAKKKIREIRKEMKAAEKSGDYKTAASKAREAASAANELSSAINNLPQSVGSAVIADLALAISAMIVSAVVGAGIGAVKGRNAQFSKITKEGVMKTKSGIASASNKWNLDMIDKDQRNAAFKEAAAAGSKHISDNLGTLGKKAAIGGLKGAGIAAGATAGVAAAAGGVATGVAYLKGKKAVDAEGNPDPKKLQPNDVNVLIKKCAMDAKMLAKRYTDMAAKYDKMASGATESYELDDDMFSNFISACEGLVIGDASETAPYLFD